jgi:rhodanese-related sulfurtransferase
VATHSRSVLIVDVRGPDEYRGELGHLEGSILGPLGTIVAAAATWPRDKPIVTVCRSGGRSGKAALALAARGFSRVASLQGGMLGWNAHAFPVEYGAAPGSAMNRQG